jgi:hypothetical protein
MTVMTAEPLRMTGVQRAALEKMARWTTLPHRKVVQAKALLLAADGVGTNEVARRCGTTDVSVRAWRRRFAAEVVRGSAVSPRRSSDYLAARVVVDLSEIGTVIVDEPCHGVSAWDSGAAVGPVGRPGTCIRQMRG